MASVSTIALATWMCPPHSRMGCRRAVASSRAAVQASSAFDGRWWGSDGLQLYRCHCIWVGFPDPHRPGWFSLAGYFQGDCTPPILMQLLLEKKFLKDS